MALRTPSHAALIALLLASACAGDDGRGSSATAASGVTGVTGATSATTAGSITGATSATGSTSGDSDSGTSADATGSTGNVTGGTATTGPGHDCDDDSQCPPGQHCGDLSYKCLGDGECVYKEDCEAGLTCQGGKCVIGGDCGAQSFELTKLAPNVMIVLDRSGSMDGDVQNSNKSRWEVAKDAIFQLVDTFNSDIRFGLVTYSACVLLNECTAGEIEVAIIDKAATFIHTFLEPKGLGYLCNSGNPETSTGNTLAALVGEKSLQDPSRANAILLITDGNENSECQDKTNATTAAGALYGQAIPVKTYAVGFSDGILGSLADVAVAGGTDVPYNANDPGSLTAALNAIAANVASCDFVLDGVPPDPDIHVFFNDDPMGIPNDPVNGWDYDPNTNTLHFYGEACAKLQMGAVVDIDVVFGCDAPIPG